MMLLRFKSEDIRRLLAMSIQSLKRKPSGEQTCNLLYLRKDLPEARRAELHAKADPDGRCWYTRIDDLDLASIPPGLWLAGSGGSVYFMTNALLDGTPDDESHLAYPEGGNPSIVGRDAAMDLKRRAFGGDDGADFFHASHFWDFLDEAPTFLVICTPAVVNFVHHNDPSLLDGSIEREAQLLQDFVESLDDDEFLKLMEEADDLGDEAKGRR